MSGSLRGEVNGWQCPSCKMTTYAVHVDDGVTPMFLACRKGPVRGTDGCGEMARSLMYPPPPVPIHVIAELEWEWYKPDDAEFATLEPQTAEHVRQGGLLLRKLTDAGREVLGLRG